MANEDAAARKTLQEQRDERAKYTTEALKRMESSKPTPTQEENDLARLGVFIDKHEDDGSGPTVIETRHVAGEPVGPHGHAPRAREKRE